MTRLLIAAALQLSCALAGVVAASAGEVVEQEPCGGQIASCATLVADRPDPVFDIVRAFSFEIARPGTALVSFHGSINCLTDNAEIPVVTDLVSQIVTTTSAVPDLGGASGGRHVFVLRHDRLGGQDTSNIAAVRQVEYGSAGIKSVYFKIKRLRMDSGFCTVRNGAFTVIASP